MEVCCTQVRYSCFLIGFVLFNIAKTMYKHKRQQIQVQIQVFCSQCISPLIVKQNLSCTLLFYCSSNRAICFGHLQVKFSIFKSPLHPVFLEATASKNLLVIWSPVWLYRSWETAYANKIFLKGFESLNSICHILKIPHSFILPGFLCEPFHIKLK